MRGVAATTAVAFCVTATVMAQSTTPQAEAPPREGSPAWARPYVSQIVVVATTHGNVSGLLVSATDEQVVVDVSTPRPFMKALVTRTPLAMVDVRRVSVRKKDPIIDGALIGAGVMVLCLTSHYCGGGFSGEHNGRDWAITIGLGAALGGATDASIHGTQQVFPQPPVGAVESRPAFVVSKRF